MEEGLRPQVPTIKIWWVDRETNQQMVIRPAAQQHDVSRTFGDGYGVILWAVKIRVP